jgi:hypothetical protein
MNNVSKENINNNLFIVLYYVFKIIPMLIAGGAIYLGYKLFILGVTGKASLSVNSKEISGQLLNAAPGLFFAIGGIIAIIISIWKGVSIITNNGKISAQAMADTQNNGSDFKGVGGGGGSFNRHFRKFEKPL